MVKECGCEAVQPMCEETGLVRRRQISMVSWGRDDGESVRD